MPRPLPPRRALFRALLRLRRPGRRMAAALAAVLCLCGFLGLESLFAPSKNLWPRWEAHDAGSAETFDHAAWGALLAAYVRPAPGSVTRFAYAAVTGADKARLDAYAARLAAAPVSGFNRDEQLAFWINAYNAMTVRAVLAHYPVDSIQDIDDAWDTPVLQIEGEAVTLNDIEHRILRPIWNDARLHYALNCASIGCPDLQAEPFTAANAEALLERAARTFINHPRAAHAAHAAQADGGELTVSSIYVWFEEDFGGDEEGVIEHLRRYADAGAPLAAALAGADGIDGHEYNWTLNGVE
ncbi:MAG: DUF547 domain-containing protein [Rhodospirillales bacterium]